MEWMIIINGGEANNLPGFGLRGQVLFLFLAMRDPGKW